MAVRRVKDAENELVSLVESIPDGVPLTEDQKDDIGWLASLVLAGHPEWRKKRLSEWYPILKQRVEGNAV